MRLVWNVTLGVFLCFATGGFILGYGQTIANSEPVLAMRSAS